MRPRLPLHQRRVLTALSGYSEPTLEYLVRWRVQHNWRQLQIPDKDRAVQTLLEMYERAGHPGPYADVELFDAEFSGEPWFPDLHFKPRMTGGPRSGRYVVCWGRRGDDTQRVAHDEPTARAYHRQLWEMERRTRGFWVSRVILVRLT